MNRAYLQTHPWLTFKIDLTKAPADLWILLGEARSKCHHIAGVPLQPSVAEELHQLYLAKGVQATTAIEGNSLTVDEVRQRMQGKLKLPQSKEYLGKEIDNIIHACNEISVKLISGDDSRITANLLKHFNAQILDGLELEEGVVAGEIRKTYNVGVGNVYVGVGAEDAEFLAGKLCDWIEGTDFQETGEHRLITALIKAIVFHIYLAWIHPFGDGNGRTARLVELQILLSAGIATPIAHLLSNHYNHTRRQYYAELDRASRSGGNIIPFIQYAVRGFVDGLREQLATIREQQWDVSWDNYVHEQFGDKKTAAAVRQKRLVLDLSKIGEVIVPLNAIHELSPTLALLYAKKTLRTVQRDVRELEQMDLVQRTAEGGVRAKREKILGFLPPHKIGDDSDLASALDERLAKAATPQPQPSPQLTLRLATTVV